MLIIFINKYIYVTFRKLASYRVTLCHLVIQTKSRNPYCTAMGKTIAKLTFLTFEKFFRFDPTLTKLLISQHSFGRFQNFLFCSVQKRILNNSYEHLKKNEAK